MFHSWRVESGEWWIFTELSFRPHAFVGSVAAQLVEMGNSRMGVFDEASPSAGQFHLDIGVTLL